MTTIKHGWKYYQQKDEELHVKKLQEYYELEERYVAIQQSK